MKPKNTPFICCLVLATGLIFSSCKKGDTSTGTEGGIYATSAGVINAKVNGETFVTSIDSLPEAYLWMGPVITGQNVSLTLSGTVNKWITADSVQTRIISFTCSQIAFPKLNKVYGNDSITFMLNYRNQYAKYKSSGGPDYYTCEYAGKPLDKINPGKIVFTKIDTTNKLASGYFNFMLYGWGATCSPTMNITEGKFTDLKIKRP